ncbi:MAG TPA: C69 family dipeptidase [Bacteroidia bacterium]|nr:C69 family dipeptidase [Bacteroidia bacterium]HRS59545.1 C69 family dipeptidase [Bacteroidia bacterium]HRU67665.1 C69 family dipeptidase [Bacteroidia bacterium]
MKRKISLFLLFTLFVSLISDACTNYIVTRGASADGSTFITYSADSHVLYGELYYKPARDYPENAMMRIYEWDSGKFLGEIKQVRHTYSVVGNMNEYQVSIGETTFGGREELVNPEGIIDYGSLIYLALQRAKTAREAIQVMTSLVDEYGYYSSGESFSIADKNECWILEMLGKGKGKKGALWVAVRIPDGYVSGHANQSRITTFPLNDPENCLYDKEVISFAREKGWYTGPDKEFSFSDAYAQPDFGGARFCDIRVWAFFNHIADGMDKYQDYVSGHIKIENGKVVGRMPLYIKPKRKITVQDMMFFMRDHLEGTAFDMTKDIGAGPWGLPYRWRPLTWKVDEKTYCNERATATQQTGFVFVAQARNWLPDPIGGIFWFGVDDANTTVFSPMYCGINKVPPAYAEGDGNMLQFSNDAAFWVFTMVSNFTYLRYSYMIEDVRKVQKELEDKFVSYMPAIDLAAKNLYDKNPELARQFLTDYSVNTGQAVVERWKQLFQYLIVKYHDGNIKKEKDGQFETNGYGMPVSPSQPGYPEWFLKKIVEDKGSFLEAPSGH